MGCRDARGATVSNGNDVPASASPSPNLSHGAPRLGEEFVHSITLLGHPASPLVGFPPYPRGLSPFQLSSMVTPLGSRTKICFTEVPGVVVARNFRPVLSTRARASS